MLDRFTAGFELFRPRTLARKSKSVDDLLSEVRDLKRAAKTMAAERQRSEALLGTLTARVEQLAGELHAAQQTVTFLTTRESQLRAVLRADAQHEAALASLAPLLDAPRIAAHIRAAVARAELRLDPFPHAIVDGVLPDDFYAALLKGIPPAELFGDKACNKQHVNVPLTVAPVYSRRVWNFFVYELQQTLQPLLIDTFRAPLAEWIRKHWPALDADPFAPPMAFNTADGRIMLRGRGYHIAPHRDPKWGFLTGILYLARARDSERWGTQLFAVDDDEDAAGAAPHWIEPARCRLVAEVPFRANTMLVMLNSTGAHGANIAGDAEPAELQRYIYQFRIGPSAAAIPRLTAMLSEAQRPLWAGKVPAA